MSLADQILSKAILPTSLSSAEIREQIAADIRRRSIFSARMESAHYLARMREVCADFADGRIGAAEARKSLLEGLAEIGITPDSGQPDRAHTGRRRLDLILKTQRGMAASVRTLASQTPEILEAWPAWELSRHGHRDEPREDWAARWMAAGNACDWRGVLKHPTKMIALKSSAVWGALGDGVGGFSDTLGNPYPPFAFNSGMAWSDVSAEECQKLGLELPEEQHTSQPSLSPEEQELREAAESVGFSMEDFL